MYSQMTELPFGYTVTFSWGNGHLHVAWMPDVPEIKNARHRRKFLSEYEVARDSFLGHVATLLDGPVVVSDLEGKARTIYPKTKH